MVSIGKLSIEHASAVVAHQVRNRAFFRPWEPERLDSWFTLEAQEQALRSSLQQWEAGTGFHFGVFIEGDLVGRVALNDVVRGAFESAHLGYQVDQGWINKGVATEAVRQALDFAFGEARLHRVQAAIIPSNRASLRVVEKLGFRPEGMALRYLRIDGRWQDHRLFALTREEWRAGPGIPPQSAG